MIETKNENIENVIVNGNHFFIILIHYYLRKFHKSKYIINHIKLFQNQKILYFKQGISINVRMICKI